METPKHTPPQLEHLEEFEALLEDYSPSEAVTDVLRKAPLVVLVGPTGSGRNTLIDELVKTGNYFMIVSDTTRAPRIVEGEPEQNGKVYWFKTEAEVLEGIREQDYVEAAVIHRQQVSGAHKREFEKAYQQGKIALKEIEVQGESTYRSHNPELKSVFLLPPAFDEWLLRLHKRSKMTNEELRRRLKSAEQEIETALSATHYLFAVNENLAECTAVVNDIAYGRLNDSAIEDAARDHARQLLIDIQLYLNS